jgi:sugar phosphate isomerase/epimerase
MALAMRALSAPTTRVAITEGPWQIGCYTRPWDQFELGVALEGIAQAGYKYAGLMTAKSKSWVIVTPDTTTAEVERIGNEAQKHALKILSVYGDFSAAESLEHSVHQLKRLIDNCAACGSPRLLLGGTSDARLYEPYYKTIKECCDYALARTVSLTIKPHGGQNATGPQCRKAIELVGHGNFRLWYDPGNIFYYSEGKVDPIDDAATVDGLVVGMSVKDFRPPKEVMVTPGTGRVDFPKVFARLKRGGFTRGPLIVECLERSADPAKITDEARKARLFLEQLTGQKA